MSSVAEILFWASVAMVSYVYAGYPLLLLVLRKLIDQPVDKQPYFPSVSLLIPAFNEAAVIREKIKNSLALDYPADKLEIVVASDGSTDGTGAAARELPDGRRVRVLDYAKNRGKVAVMNDAFPELKGDIVVFSDASSMLMPEAVREIVQNFHDPRVGAVSGIYRVRATEQSSTGAAEQLYWKYETFLRTQESALDSLLGGHGHLYAIRKELYFFPPAGTINDDYVIPVRIVARGFRAIYEPKAIGWEEAAEMAGFKRRVRIMAGNLQQLRELPRLVRRPLPLFFALSHKLGRLMVPFGMAGAFLASVALLGDPLYRIFFGAQLGFYVLACAGALLPLRPKILRVPYYFSMINAAAFVAIYHAAGSRRRLEWK